MSYICLELTIFFHEYVFLVNVVTHHHYKEHMVHVTHKTGYIIAELYDLQDFGLYITVP